MCKCIIKLECRTSIHPSGRTFSPYLTEAHSLVVDRYHRSSSGLLIILIQNPEKSANLDGAFGVPGTLLECPLSQRVGATGTVLGGHVVESKPLQTTSDPSVWRLAQSTGTGSAQTSTSWVWVLSWSEPDKPVLPVQMGLFDANALSNCFCGCTDAFVCLWAF